MRSPLHYLKQTLGNSTMAQEPYRVKRNQRIRATYQTMEPRMLLAGIEFLPDTSQVLIGGTQQPDSATVVQRGPLLIVTQSGFPTQTFQASGVSSVVFVGLGGDDFFQNFTNIPSSAFGGAGEDTLIGGSGNDVLAGNTGNDLVNGNGGNDRLVAGNGDDRVNGGAGNDFILGIRGTNFLNGNAGNDTIHGGFNQDNISGGDGDDLLTGSSGNDFIVGNNGDDLIFGGAGNDNGQGGGGDDRIIGQNGNDNLNGGLGADFVSGNAGDDRLSGDLADDRLFGGVGDDQASFDGDINDFRVSFFGDNAVVDDLRGPTGLGEDNLFAIETLTFNDGFQNQNGPPVFNDPQPPEDDPNAPPIDDGPDEPTVTLQPIIVSNSDGANSSEFFGNDGQETQILELIDIIFDQAGVDIEFLPEVTIDDTFINVGNNPGFTGERPDSDLDAIVQRGDDEGVGSTDPFVIDIYFVEFVPGFTPTGENVANGLAFVGAPGIAIHIGDDLAGSAGGRTVIAEVTAHEIGHNLGLGHLAVDGNLLAPGGFGGGGSDLNDEQIATILNSPLVR